MNKENPRKKRPKKKLRDIIKLGKGSKVVVRPTTKSSQENLGDGEIKEETNIFKLLRRQRKRKTTNKKLIRKNMKVSGAFPPLQPVAMSENDLKCHDHRASIVRNEDFESEVAERRARNKRTWAACKRALGREKEIFRFRDDDDLTRGDE